MLRKPKNSFLLTGSRYDAYFRFKRDSALKLIGALEGGKKYIVGFPRVR